VNRHDRDRTLRALEQNAHGWLDAADRAEANGEHDDAATYRTWAAQEARQAADLVRGEAGR
jgi:hypothetical protein